MQGLARNSGTLIQRAQSSHSTLNYRYEVFNGEIGDHKGTYIDFGEGRIIPCTEENLRDVELAFAITIHKSQGSEYPEGIYVVNPSDNRRLVYTAMTRMKERLVVIGKRHHFEEVIQREPDPIRTLFKEVSLAG